MGLGKGTGNHAGFLGGPLMRNINLGQPNVSAGGGIPPVQGLDFTPIAQTGNAHVNNDAFPLTKWYEDTYAGYIITAAEMAGAKTLDGISLWKEDQPSSTGTTVYGSVWIKIAHTTDSVFPSGTLDVSGASNSAISLSNILTLTDETTVLTETNLSHTGTENEWTAKMAFDTNFEYNGSDNLVVLFIADTPTWTSIRLDYGTQTGGNSTNRMFNGVTDVPPQLYDQSGTRASSRPATKIYY